MYMRNFLLPLILTFAALQFSFAQYKTSYTVAPDGTGDYTSIQAVLNVCKSFPDQRIQINLKPESIRKR